MKQSETLPIDGPRQQPLAPAGLLASRITDKTEKAAPVKVTLKNGQIIVENKTNGVLFSFPANAWPLHWNPQTQAMKRMEWITRLTPWWDAPGWTPLAHRLRESCVKAINKLTAPCSKNREPLTDRDLSLSNLPTIAARQANDQS
jgi:hypothetical protein